MILQKNNASHAIATDGAKMEKAEHKNAFLAEKYILIGNVTDQLSIGTCK